MTEELIQDQFELWHLSIYKSERPAKYHDGLYVSNDTHQKFAAWRAGVLSVLKAAHQLESKDTGESNL